MPSDGGKGSRLRSISAVSPPSSPRGGGCGCSCRARSLSAASAQKPAPGAALIAAASEAALRHNFLSCLIITAQNGYGEDVEPFLALSYETWCEEQLWDAIKDRPHGALKLKNADGTPLMVDEVRADGTTVRAQAVDPFGKKRTRLMYAAQKGDLSRLKWLLARGARVQLKDWQGFTALHWACQAGRLDTAMELLARGARAEVDGGLTPLLIASYTGRVEVVRELLKRGAPLHAALLPGAAPSAERPPAAYVGATPLYAASAKGHVEVVRVLLEYGAPVDTVKGNGTAALHTACASPPPLPPFHPPF